MEGKPFKLRSGNKPAFKMMGAKTPAKHKVDGSYRGHSHEGMGLFERVTGKKFKDTTIGKGFYNEDGELKIKADLEQKSQDIQDLGTDVVKNQTPGTTKKERENVQEEQTTTTTTPEVTNLGATDDMSFSKAFRTARDTHGGKGGEFTWKGNRYTTNTGSEEEDSPTDMKSPVKLKKKDDTEIRKKLEKQTAKVTKQLRDKTKKEKEKEIGKSPAKRGHDGELTTHQVFHRRGKKATNPKYTEKVADLRNKMKEIEAKNPDATVENNRRLRRLQNQINKEMDSNVRHRKNIFTGGKYKKVTKK